MTVCALVLRLRSDYLRLETSALKSAAIKETPMLYILQNRNSLAIAWNGRAPQHKTIARWEIRNPISFRKA